LGDAKIAIRRRGTFVTYRIVIATPVDRQYGVDPGYAVALAQILRDNADVRLLPAHITYDVDIVRARNRLAAMVLREMPEATHVLWWDSDIVPHDLNVIGRMLATGRPLIGAPYLRKRLPPTWTHRGVAAPMGTDWVSVHSIGFGFTITSTDLLRTMGEIAARYLDKRTDGTKHAVLGLFDLAYMIDAEGDPVQESEDYSFCYRARAYTQPALWVGPCSLLSHVGSHAFTPGAK
jgi:hypothetical protein